MPFVPDPDLQHDLFLSYAHIDNLEGWVERFEKKLWAMLTGKAGARVEIWRDPALDGATRFDTVIERKLEQSAVFLALCSNGYKKSDYCRHEVDVFRNRHGDAGLRVGEWSRLVRVRLYNLPYEDLPGTADRTGAFDFFTAEGKDDIGTPLETDSREFREQMDQLAKALLKILENLKRAGAGEAPGKGEVKPKAPGEVFLGEVSDPLRRTRGRLAADLTARAVTLAARVPPPFAAAEHEAAVRRALEGCRLGVYLFDAWEDNPVQGRLETTYAREQLRLAQEAGVPQVIWISQRVRRDETTSSESGDPAWISFLNGLESARRDEGQYRVVRCPPSELASVVSDRLAELRAPLPAPAGTPSVLLDVHEKDHLVAFDVGKALLSSGVRPDVVAQEDDPRQNADLFAERLKQAQGFLVLFGQASEQWVLARLGEALKLSYTARRALKFYGVLLAPPDEGKSPGAFEHPFFKTHVLDIRRGVSPDALKPVLQGLGVGAG